MPAKGLQTITRAEILSALKQTVAECGENVSLTQFSARLGIARCTVRERWGTWAHLRAAAGLKRPRAVMSLEFSDDDLLLEYRRIVQALGRDPTETEFNIRARCRWATIKKRFGKKSEIRRRVRMLEQTLEDFGRPNPLPDKPRLPWDAAWLQQEWGRLRVGFAMYASDIRNDLIRRGYNAAADWTVAPQPATIPPQEQPVPPLPQSRNPMTPPQFPFDLLFVLENDWPGAPIPVLRLREVSRWRQSP